MNMNTMMRRNAVLLSAWVLTVAAGCKRDAQEGTSPTPTAAEPSAKGYGPPRLNLVTCPSSAPVRPAEVPSGCESCKPDEHCRTTTSHGQVFGACTKSTCTKDEDCPGALCLCGPPHACSPGNCRTDADCGGRTCQSARLGKTGTSGRFCRTSTDTCATDADCKPGTECAYLGASFGCRKAIPIPPG